MKKGLLFLTCLFLVNCQKNKSSVDPAPLPTPEVLTVFNEFKSEEQLVNAEAYHKILVSWKPLSCLNQRGLALPQELRTNDSILTEEKTDDISYALIRQTIKSIRPGQLSLRLRYEKSEVRDEGRVFEMYLNGEQKKLCRSSVVNGMNDWSCDTERPQETDEYRRFQRAKREKCFVVRAAQQTPVTTYFKGKVTLPNGQVLEAVGQKIVLGTTYHTEDNNDTCIKSTPSSLVYITVKGLASGNIERLCQMQNPTYTLETREFDSGRTSTRTIKILEAPVLHVR